MEHKKSNLPPCLHNIDARSTIHVLVPAQGTSIIVSHGTSTTSNGSTCPTYVVSIAKLLLKCCTNNYCWLQKKICKKSCAIYVYINMCELERIVD
jgi:hypothetical protein